MPQQNLACDKDAYVDEASPDTNHGTSTVLRVRSQGGVLGPGDRRLLCSFDLSGLPANATRIVTAILRLAPISQSAIGRTLRCEQVVEPWAEDEVTWNDQPAIGSHHGTQASSSDPQEWNVLSSVSAAFPGGRVDLRVRDDSEGSSNGSEQEYDSREGAGPGPLLVLTYETEEHAHFQGFVRPTQFEGATALACTVVVRRSSTRFGQQRRRPLEDGELQPTSPSGVAYDENRDSLWVTDQDDRIVRRYDAHTLELQQEYVVPGDFAPVGCAYDGSSLWLSDDLSSTMTIRRFEIGPEGLAEQASYGHDFRTVLAWDGTTLWSADTILGTVYKHDLDADLTVSESYDLGVQPWGLSFPDVGSQAYLLEDAPDGFRFTRRRSLDLVLEETWPYLGDPGGAPIAVSFVPGHPSGSVVSLERDRSELLLWAQGDLASTTRPGRIPGRGTLVSIARPGNIPTASALATQIVANVNGGGVLATLVTPQFAGLAWMGSTVQPTLFEVVAQGRAEGRIGSPIVVDAQDFRDITSEVGSTIEWTRAGETTTLRRIIQIVDTQDSRTYPREQTSRHRHANTHSRISRGDAILYALGDDTFRPGDAIGWAGRRWIVLGLLGSEIIGDVAVYQEVGLRRLPITTAGRVEGTVAP